MKLGMISRNLESLEMAKKRDHKIMITDEAINKVPYIEYLDIPVEEYPVIHMLVKKVLEIAKNENNSNEVAITYRMGDIDGNLSDCEIPFGLTIGDEHSADPTSDTYSYQLLTRREKDFGDECLVISLHNHPSISKISLLDVRFFLEYRKLKLLLVVTNAGNIYYLCKGKRYNREDAIKIFNKSVELNNMATSLKELQKAADYFLNNCYKAGVIYKDR